MLQGSSVSRQGPGDMRSLGLLGCCGKSTNPSTAVAALPDAPGRNGWPSVSEAISKAMSKPMSMSISALNLRSPVSCSQAHAQDVSKAKVTKPQGPLWWAASSLSLHGQLVRSSMWLLMYRAWCQLTALRDLSQPPNIHPKDYWSPEVLCHIFQITACLVCPQDIPNETSVFA